MELATSTVCESFQLEEEKNSKPLLKVSVKSVLSQAAKYEPN
jgi:hypothetical protein